MYIYVAQILSEIWPETWIYQFGDFWFFVRKSRHFLQNTVFAKTCFFGFLAISPAFSEQRRCTIPHFNPLNKLIWPLENKICSRLWSFLSYKAKHLSNFFNPDFTCFLKKFEKLTSWGACSSVYHGAASFVNFTFPHTTTKLPCNSSWVLSIGGTGSAPTKRLIIENLKNDLSYFVYSHF